MANYPGKFLPHLASYICPIEDLLNDKNGWSWKELAPYSQTAEMCVFIDASSFWSWGCSESTTNR